MASAAPTVRLFVPSDLDAITIRKMPYTRPHWQLVVLFVGDERPETLTTRYGANGCLCIDRSENVALRITDAGAWAIMPVRRVGREADSLQIIEVPRGGGQHENMRVPATDLARLPRMTMCEGAGVCP